MNSRIDRQNSTRHVQDRTLVRAFQNSLEKLSLDAGLSRQEFAQQLKIPRSSYFHLMTAAANPSLDYIETIAKSAGVDPLALLSAPVQCSGRTFPDSGSCYRSGVHQPKDGYMSAFNNVQYTGL